MSRSKNDHKKSYNFPLRIAKEMANKSVRNQSKRILVECIKGNLDVDATCDLKNRSGKGDIWNYD